jgi:acetyltransferase-like isoleucine patch superfamily enzyme
VRLRAEFLGAGGHGRVILGKLRCHPEVELVGFVDGAYPDLDGLIAGVPIRGSSAFLDGATDRGLTHSVVAIGDNRIRARKFQDCTAAGLEPLAAVHPRPVVAPDAEVGSGAQVMAGVVLGTGGTVDHDRRIADHAFIAPGAHLGGAVTVGEGAFIGIGASAVQGLPPGLGPRSEPAL